MSFNYLKIHERGKIRELVLDIDDTNRLRKEVFVELRDAVKQLEKDKHCRVIVLRSASEGYFSNGLDPAMFLNKTRPELHELCRVIIESAKHFFQFPRPTITVVNGHSMGAGSAFAILSDYRFMADKGGRIGFPEVLIGMNFPSFIAMVLKDLVGHRNARDLLYTGKALKSAEALSMGLVDEVHKPDKVLEAAFALAEKLAKSPVVALEGLKRAMHFHYKPLIDNIIEQDIAAMTEILLAPATQEGFCALRENRRPKFPED